jgi:hypothetical protein
MHIETTCQKDDWRLTTLIWYAPDVLLRVLQPPLICEYCFITLSW